MSNFDDPKINISKVYTRLGDKGTTHLIGGEVVSKDDPRVRSYGNTEEINVYIGFCINRLKDYPEIQEYDYLLSRLTSIQNELFNLGTYLASVGYESPNNLPRVTSEDTSLLEEDIDKMNIKLEPLDSFVLPGGNSLILNIHLARIVCRRAERRIISLVNLSYDIDSNIISYINRLSDYLFVLGRWVSNQLNVKEDTWSPNKITSKK